MSRFGQRATWRATPVQLPCNMRATPCNMRGGHPPYTPGWPARLHACTALRLACPGHLFIVSWRPTFESPRRQPCATVCGDCEVSADLDRSLRYVLLKAVTTDIKRLIWLIAMWRVQRITNMNLFRGH